MTIRAKVTPSFSKIITCAMTLAVSGSVAFAVDHDFRIVPQLMVGTAGLEPGLALEYRGMDGLPFILRPELLISEDGNLGAGFAALYDVSRDIDVPKRHALAFGPRVLYHNADDYGWAADAMAIWGYDLGGDAQIWRHSIEVLGAIGTVHHRRDHDNDLGLSLGIGYAYGF